MKISPEGEEVHQPEDVCAGLPHHFSTTGTVMEIKEPVPVHGL
ncbi:hypothetical protein [Nafulsella turpanensis]|nr:hypothetical protein [Nafulsella turpanensis]